MASNPTRDLQEEFLAATRKSQDAMIRAIRTWAETVRAVTPKLPSFYAPLADRLPRLPSVTLPFADKLPKPEDLVASGYDFAEHLLAVQRKFAEDLLKATVPLIPGNGKSATKDTPVKAQPAAVKTDAGAVAEKTATAEKAAVAETAAVAEKAVAATAPKPPAVQSEPQAPAVPSEPKAPANTAPKAPAAKAAPKPAAAKSEPKATPPASAPKPPAAKRAASAPKPTATRRAPKPTDAS